MCLGLFVSLLRYNWIDLMDCYLCLCYGQFDFEEGYLYLLVPWAHLKQVKIVWVVLIDCYLRMCNVCYGLGVVHLSLLVPKSRRGERSIGELWERELATRHSDVNRAEGNAKFWFF